MGKILRNPGLDVLPEEVPEPGICGYWPRTGEAVIWCHLTFGSARPGVGGATQLADKLSLIDDRDVIERVLRHLGLWEQGVRVHTGADPPAEYTLEPWLEDPFPDYETEPVLANANS